MYLSQRCCQMAPSQHLWVWSCLVFLSLSSLGTLRENASATDLFTFELNISGVGQESQLMGLCTYPVLLMGLPFYVRFLPHVLVLDLAIIVMKELVILQKYSWTLNLPAFQHHRRKISCAPWFSIAYTWVCCGGRASNCRLIIILGGSTDCSH